MNSLKYTFVALAVAALGLSNLAEARDHTRGDAGLHRGFAETRTQPHQFDRRGGDHQRAQHSDVRGDRAAQRVNRASHDRHDSDRGHHSLRHSARDNHRYGGRQDFHPGKDHGRDYNRGRSHGRWW